MLTAALERSLSVRWLACDEIYGASGELRSVAEAAGLGFVMAVRSNHWIDLDSGGHLACEDALASVAPSLRWETRSCGTGSKGMRLFQWAHLDLADGMTLLMRRWPIEEIHRDAKQLACIDAYQVRTWTALHRHLTLGPRRRC